MCSSFVFKACFLWYFIQFSTLKLLFLYEHIKCINLLVEIERSVRCACAKSEFNVFSHPFSLSSVLLQTFCTLYQFHGINAFKSIIFIMTIYQMECIYSQLKIWLSVMIISNEHCLQRFLLNAQCDFSFVLFLFQSLSYSLSFSRNRKFIWIISAFSIQLTEKPIKNHLSQRKNKVYNPYTQSHKHN